MVELGAHLTQNFTPLGVDGLYFLKCNESDSHVGYAAEIKSSTTVTKIESAVAPHNINYQKTKFGFPQSGSHTTADSEAL